MSAPPLSDQRAIIDRRKLAQAIAEFPGEGGESRDAVLALLRDALKDGRAELSRRLVEHPAAGHAQCGGQSFLLKKMARAVEEAEQSARPLEQVCP